MLVVAEGGGLGEVMPSSPSSKPSSTTSHADTSSISVTFRTSFAGLLAGTGGRLDANITNSRYGVGGRLTVPEGSAPNEH